VKRARIMVLVSLLSIGFSVPVVRAAAPSEDAGYLLTGLRDSRQRLRSGVFRATGRLTNDFKEDQPLDGDVEIFCAFDIDRKLVRFDRRQPVRWADPREKAASRPMARFIATAEQSVHFDENTPRLFIRPASAKPSSLVHPWDVRSIGLVPENSMHEPFDDIFELYVGLPGANVTRDADQTCRITWIDVRKWGDTLHALWIDESRGFTPVRYECRDRRPSQGAALDAPWPAALSTNELTWQEFSGVWVPTAMSLENHGARRGRERFDLTFDWEVVNGPVPAKYFDPVSFNAPGDWRVIDERLGRPIGLGKVDAVFPPRTPMAAASPSGPIAFWIILIVGATAAVLLMLFFTRRRTAA
jgi:hypothetical protein